MFKTLKRIKELVDLLHLIERHLADIRNTLNALDKTLKSCVTEKGHRNRPQLPGIRTIAWHD